MNQSINDLAAAIPPELQKIAVSILYALKLAAEIEENKKQ